MGRKIPGKKHRGIKDPFVQRAKRNEELKNKINAPPLDPNDQEIPKKVKDIMKFQENLKTGNVKKKTKRPKNKLLDTFRFMGCGPKLSGLDQDDKSMIRVCQRIGESETSFLNRVDLATADIISEANIEGQHNVKVKRNVEGVVEKVEMGIKDQNTKQSRKRTKDLVENKINRPSKKQRKKKKFSTEEKEPLLERKLDYVKFGEVVHAPPHLKAKPRGSDKTAKAKCGSLLLNHFLNKNKIETCPSTKLKEEQRRIDVVQAYRQLKANRTNTGKI